MNNRQSSDNQSTTAKSATEEDFDWQLHSPLNLPSRDKWRFRTLGAMLESDDTDLDSQSLLIGADHTGPLELTLADLRRVARRADQWCEQQGIIRGDSLLLVRLPHSSELPLAAAVVALMSLGFRVVLPMNFDHRSLAEMADATHCRALLWCADFAARSSRSEVLQADAMFRFVAKEQTMVAHSLDGPNGWHLPPTAEESTRPAIGKSLNFSESDEREVLVLSTSGSTGQPKLVRYTDCALLRVAEAWNAAGLLSETLLGGRSICPTLSHSMGLRNVLHAIWNRQPTLLAQPEWLEEKPKQFVQLLERCRPQHITCGPALLGDLGLLAANLRRVREALSTLRCVVSSGAADPTNQPLLQSGVRVANAFGMTELQQVLNTLLSPQAKVSRALGSPLPGVSVAVRYIDDTQRLGQLFVSSPFAALGYVSAPNFGTWFDTGDLVRVEGDDLIWMGRADDDFLNTGLGVKVSLNELHACYEQLQLNSEAVLFLGSSSNSGIAAIIFVGDRDPSSTEVHLELKTWIAADHEHMATEQRHFALSYTAISVVGCVAGRPPKRGPGKIDRQKALSEQAELLTEMEKPNTYHPQVFQLTKHGSDRPDWKRFATRGS